jgi:hypothetical protein
MQCECPVINMAHFPSSLPVETPISNIGTANPNVLQPFTRTPTPEAERSVGVSAGRRRLPEGKADQIPGVANRKWSPTP